MAKETVARAALGGLVAGLAPAVLIYGFVLLVLPALLVIPTLCLAVFLCGDAVVHGRPKSVDRTNKRIAYGSVITIFIVFSNGLSAAGEFGFAMVGGYATAAATGAIICSGLRWWRIESKRAPHPQR